MAFKEVNNGAAGNWIKWQQPGQVVEGRLIGVKTGKAFQGRNAPSRFAIIEKSDASRVNMPLTTVLESAFADINPGVVVRVTYLGTAKGQSGVDYKNFKVEVDDGGAPTALSQAAPGAVFAGAAAPPIPAGYVPVQSAPANEYDTLSVKLIEKVGEAAGKAQLAALAQLVPDPAVRTQALKQQLTQLGVPA